MNLNKYFVTIKLELNRLMEYRLNFFLRLIVNTTVPLIISVFLLTSIFKFSGQDEIAGFNTESVIIYTLWASLITLIIEIRSTIENISQDIRLGRITRYLLYPISMFEITIFQFIASFIVQGLCFIGLISLLHFFYDGFTVLYGQPEFYLAVAFTVLGSFFWFVVHYTIGLITFWLDEIWPFFIIFQMFARLLSGRPFPLDFHWGKWPLLGEIYYYLPFQWFVYVPTRLFTGNLTLNDTINGKPLWGGLFVLMFWCLLTFVFTSSFWKAGVKKYSAAGM